MPQAWPPAGQQAEDRAAAGAPRVNPENKLLMLILAAFLVAVAVAALIVLRSYPGP